jgi:hypothetical protein
MPQLLSTIKRFIGLSTEAKPTDCSDGSTFLETDTGNMYVFNKTSGSWALKEEANLALRLETKNLLGELLEETKKTNENLILVIEALGG